MIAVQLLMVPHLEAALSLEMRLLLALIRWPLTPAEEEAVMELAGARPVWAEVYALGAHHRVLPLAYRNLAQCGVEPPEPVRSKWKAAATRNAYAVMRSIAETVRLQSLLARENIEVCVLKGVPLSVLAYGDPSVREVGDLDLLLSPGEEERADTLLLAGGFKREEPAARLTPRRRLSYRKHMKDYTYAPGEAGFEIDLHWRLFRNRWMPGNQLGSGRARKEIQLGGHSFYTLPPEQSLLHLCVHGALDSWFRLKTLADVAALWRGLDAHGREAVLDLARKDRVIAGLAAALLLAGQLLLLQEGDLPPSLVLLDSDKFVRRILNQGLRQFHHSQLLPHEATLNSWSMKRYELELQPGLRYRLEILQRVLFRPRVWETFDLPDAMFPLYALLSPIEWVVFHSRRRRAESLKLSGTASWWRNVRRRWTRLWQIAFADRMLLIEAGCSLLVARLALQILPAKSILHWARSGDSPRGSSSIPDTAQESLSIDRVRWAVLTATRHAPLRFVCFPQALAGHAMLRRRHVGSEVVYGVRRSAEGKLRAHTWLRVGERTVLGGETAPLFFRVDPWSTPQSR